MMRKTIIIVKLPAVLINPLLLPCFFIDVSAFTSLYIGIIIKKIILKELYKFKVLLQVLISPLDKVWS